MSRTIKIKGIGTATKKPDYVLISMTIESKMSEYEKVVKDLMEKVEKLNTSLVNLGFREDSLKTNNFNVTPCYKQIEKGDFNYENVFEGYCATYSLKLEFPINNGKLNDVLDEMSNNGVYSSFLVSFIVKDISSVTDEILRSATINARQKARVLCEASSERLGKLESIEYDCQNYDLTSSFEISCENGNPLMAKNISVSPDDVIITDIVTFVWELQ